MASHLTLLWKWDFLELGNGLFLTIFIYPKFSMSVPIFPLVLPQYSELENQGSAHVS